MVNAKPSFKVQKFNEVRVCVNGQYSKALKILKKKNGTEFSMLYARLHMYLSYKVLQNSVQRFYRRYTYK